MVTVARSATTARATVLTAFGHLTGTSQLAKMLVEVAPLLSSEVARGMTATAHWNADQRAGVWPTFSQLLPATGGDARRSSMNSPATSRCVFHLTVCRRIAGIFQD
jgi:hypothetical protein